MKKGFTLQELLVVIAILALLAIFAVPKFLDYYNNSLDELMRVQEKEVLDAAMIYVEDYCNSPIDSTYICPSSYINKKLIRLSDLKSSGLIDTVQIKDEECDAIIYMGEKNEKTYLKCGVRYNTDEIKFNEYETMF